MICGVNNDALASQCDQTQQWYFGHIRKSLYTVQRFLQASHTISCIWFVMNCKHLQSWLIDCEKYEFYMSLALHHVNVSRCIVRIRALQECILHSLIHISLIMPELNNSMLAIFIHIIHCDKAYQWCVGHTRG